MPARISASMPSASEPVSTSRSAGPRSVVQASTSCSGVAFRTSASSSSWFARCVASSACAAAIDTTFCSPMPAVKSRPSASNGATEQSAAAAATRSGSSAATASACGPPPDSPHVHSRSIPSASQIAATSAAHSATSRPGVRVEPPYPGRS